MIMSLVLFETEFLHIVSISFTALILNELIMVALEITTWYVLLSGSRNLLDIFSSRHIYMVISEVVTLFFYVISIAFLPEYFGAYSAAVAATQLTEMRRPDICCDARVWVEGGCDRGAQCAAAVHYQADSEQNCPRSV
jgi:hypothetical protein